jgi:hypothetical protein
VHCTVISLLTSPQESNSPRIVNRTAIFHTRVSLDNHHLLQGFPCAEDAIPRRLFSLNMWHSILNKKQHGSIYVNRNMNLTARIMQSNNASKQYREFTLYKNVPFKIYINSMYKQCPRLTMSGGIVHLPTTSHNPLSSHVLAASPEQRLTLRGMLAQKHAKIHPTQNSTQ